MFKIAKDLNGVWQSENHLYVEWEKAPVVFSFAQQGDAISAHFSSKKEGLRYIKDAINDFCQWAFYNYPWCKMILACILKDSVVRIVKKCSFKHVATKDDQKIYARLR